MPPRPEFHGSCVASASAVATAASIALPPASSTATPASAAPFACDTTMPRRPVADGLLSCQCCVTCGGGVYCMAVSLVSVCGWSAAIGARGKGGTMALLILAALIWIGMHIGISGHALRDAAGGADRRRAVPRRCSRCSRSSHRAAGLGVERGRGPTPLWYAPAWLRWVLVAVMLAAFLLFVASVSQPNPTMIGGEHGWRSRRAASSASRAIRCCGRSRSGRRCTSLATATARRIVFFGAFLVTALAGMPSIDAKLARRDPATWQALSATTSILPFAAIAQGRNRFVLREIGWLPPLIGLVAWAVVLHLHPWLFGVAPVAM